MTNPLLKLIGIAAILLVISSPELKAQPEAFLEKGHELFKQKEFDKALKEFEKAHDAFEDKNMFKEAVESMEFIAKVYMHQYKTDKAIEYYHKMAKLSKENNWEDIYSSALNSLLVIKEFKSEYDSVEVYARLILNSEVEDYKGRSNAYLNLGNVKRHKMQFDSAEFYIQKAVDIDKLHQDSSSLPFTLIGLATLKSVKGLNSEALDLCIEASSWLRPGEDDFKRITIYREIAIYFLIIRNIPKAKEYINESIEFAKKFKTTNNLAYSLMERASVYEKEENYEEALRDYEQVLEILQGTKTNYALARANLGICRCYLSMDIFDTCEPFLESYKEVSKDIKNEKLDLKYSLISADLNLSKNSLDLAKIYLDQSQTNPSLENNVYAQQSLLNLKAEYFEKTNDPGKALAYYKKFKQVRDSIYTVTQSIAMSEMESRFNKKENDLEIAKLELKDHKNQVQINKQRAVLILGGLILFCLSYLIFRIFSQKKQIEKQNNTISQSLKEKELLLKEIHHRVKNNLQIISSLLSLQSQYIDDPNVNSAIQEGRNRVKSMSLIHQNLYQKDNLAGVQVREYMLKLFQNLFDSYNIAPNRISLKTDIDQIDLDIDTIIPLGLVINELLTNALKYAFPDKREGEINLTIKEEENQLLVEVKDDGVGMENPEEMSSSQSFGFELIEAFQQKLNADLEIESSNGTRVSLKIKNYKKVA